ncbi:glycosyltransferase family 2 protein [Pediococcus acidilactici]|uniref:glycosyltransferase family 2 protein n=1 Tax=Pediococcus acidilactici TaxID=1254 RepID=UPI000E5CC23C|nr:glycosyltransferase family 2 protein [Pediococcus acidilactici]RJF47247.1 glycosyltransferase family 2 protein [Pediococcus acidilactici]
MKALRIAVIMSTYNGEKFVEEQITSILKQRIKDDYDLNVYIRDDGSKDKTLDILKKIAFKNEKVHILNTKKNVGVRLSFFELLKHVEADYYFFADQDDVWNIDKIEKILDVFESTNSKDLVGVYSDLELVDSNLNDLGYSMMENQGWSYEEDRSFSFLIFHYRITGASFAINKTVRDFVIGYSNTTFEDINMHDSFIALLIAACNGLYFIPEKLVKYRQHSGNVIGAYSKKTSKINFKSRLLGFKAFFKDLELLSKKSDYLSIPEENKLVLEDVEGFINANSLINKIKAVINAKTNVWKSIGWKNVFFLILFY